MSSIKFELQAEVRSNTGRGASRRLRYADKVPAIIYGGDQPPTSLVLEHNKVLHALSHEAFYSHILTLMIDNKSEKVILKDVQRNPAKPRILHMDFQRIRADQKLHMHIPLHFIGDTKAPGLSEGGVISHIISDVEISCLPADLPEYIEVDTSRLKLDETLHLSDLKLPKGVTLVAFSHGIEGHDLPVVSLHKPRMIEEEVVVAEEAVAEGGEAKPAAETAPATAKAGEAEGKGSKKEKE